MKDPFQRDHRPPIGGVEHLAPGLRCVTVGNASPMTFTGTRSYIVGEGDVAIIDPGPHDLSHLEALMKALQPGEQISHIFVTHSHLDHSPLAATLSARTGAPVYGFGPSGAGQSETMRALSKQGFDLGGGEGIDPTFHPDHMLSDGAVVAGAGWALRALHTPGHMSNHLSYEWVGQGAVFSGDHVMGWATTLISPPDGDLTAFMTSLERMQRETADHVFYPGHGAPVAEPLALIAYQIAHRQGREVQILTGLEGRPRTIPDLVRDMYREVDPMLHPAAARNVFAHLIDLTARGRVEADGPLSPQAQFTVR